MSEIDPKEPVEDSAYRELFFLSPDAIFIQDYEGTVLNANDRALQLHGMTREELIGSNVFDLVPKEDLATVRRDFGRWITGEMHQTRGNSVGPNGESVPVEIRSSKVTYKGKQALLFHVRDISDQIENENELNQSREHLQNLLNQLHEGVWTLDMEGATVYANPALLEMLGVEETAISQRALTSFLHSSDARFELEGADILEQFCKAAAEVIFANASGEEVHCLVRASRTKNSEGIRDAYQLNVQNLTETLSLQQQLFQAQKMEAFGRLVGGIAHDFNNLLMAISGQAEFLASELPPQHSARADAEKMVQITKRGTDLVRKLLVFSRQETIGGDLFDLADCLLHVEELVKRLMPKNIRITFDPPDEPIVVQGNMGNLEQVVLNLVINARDAMKDGDGGEIQITVDIQTPKPDERNGLSNVDPMACITVRDNGVGIPAEILPNIFEPFFSTKPKDKGTGLGLSTAYGIVKQHDGSIVVDSEPAQGTTFKIYLPITEQEESDEEEVYQFDRQHQRILLVEDDTAVLKVVVQMLRHLRKEVYETGSAEEAIELFEANPPNSFGLVVSDLLLPGKNGAELKVEMRKHDPGIPILLTTGCDDAQIMEIGWEVDENARILHKPFGMVEFMQKVSELSG